MPCRHDMSPTARRQLLVLELSITTLKLAELALIGRERRRIRNAKAAIEAARARARAGVPQS